MQDCYVFWFMVYITVSGGQVIVTVNSLALLYIWQTKSLHLETETEQDQTRLPLLQYLHQKNPKED
jgi:hypothetical protein